MDSVNKTLYIPLYGKAFVSKKGILLSDQKSEEIWDQEGFPLKGKAASKWLAYYMGMRSAVFDRWTKAQMENMPEACIVHIGCGMDSRCLRVDHGKRRWYDVDFPEVIRERRKYFAETDCYRMLSEDMRRSDWKQQIPAGEQAIVVMEGVSMYFQREALETLLRSLRSHFSQVTLLMDVYTTFAAKATKYKNPINEVGVTTVYGIDDPDALAKKTGYCYVREHTLTPTDLIAQLTPWERVVFSNLFAGKFARKIYRLHEFKTE